MSLTKQGKYRSTDFENSKHTLLFHATKPVIHASAETEEPLEDHEHEDESAGHPAIAGIAKSLQNPWQKYATAAFVAIVAVGIWFAWREMHRSHAESLRIIIGDFENSTGNLDFDQTLRTALTIDLRQSPYLEVATRDQLSKAILEENAQPQALPMENKRRHHLPAASSAGSAIASTIRLISREKSIASRKST